MTERIVDDLILLQDSFLEKPPKTIFIYQFDENGDIEWDEIEDIGIPVENIIVSFNNIRNKRVIDIARRRAKGV
jgi:hypothetical protein